MQSIVDELNAVEAVLREQIDYFEKIYDQDLTQEQCVFCACQCNQTVVLSGRYSALFLEWKSLQENPEPLRIRLRWLASAFLAKAKQQQGSFKSLAAVLDIGVNQTPFALWQEKFLELSEQERTSVLETARTAIDVSVKKTKPLRDQLALMLDKARTNQLDSVGIEASRIIEQTMPITLALLAQKHAVMVSANQTELREIARFEAFHDLSILLLDIASNQDPGQVASLRTLLPASL